MEDFEDQMHSLEDLFSGLDDETKKVTVNAINLYAQAVLFRAELHDLNHMRSTMDALGSMTAMLGKAISEQEIMSGVFDEETSEEANSARSNRERYNELQDNMDNIVRIVKEKEDDLLPRLEEFLDEIVTYGSTD